MKASCIFGRRLSFYYYNEFLWKIWIKPPTTYDELRQETKGDVVIIKIEKWLLYKIKNQNNFNNIVRKALISDEKDIDLKIDSSIKYMDYTIIKAVEDTY